MTDDVSKPEAQSFAAWWNAVPEVEKPALKTLAVLLLIGLTAGAASTIYSALIQ